MSFGKNTKTNGLLQKLYVMLKILLSLFSSKIKFYFISKAINRKLTVKKPVLLLETNLNLIFRQIKENLGIL